MVKMSLNYSGVSPFQKRLGRVYTSLFLVWPNRTLEHLSPRCSSFGNLWIEPNNWILLRLKKMVSDHLLWSGSTLV